MSLFDKCSNIQGGGSSKKPLLVHVTLQYLTHTLLQSIQSKARRNVFYVGIDSKTVVYHTKVHVSVNVKTPSL